MVRSRMIAALVPGALALALLVAPAAASGTEVKYLSVTYVTKLEVKPVGDVEGHVAGTWERRGLCIYPKNEVAVYHGAGTLDFTKGKGVIKGESTCTFEGGSSLTAVYAMSHELGPKGLAVYKGRGDFTGGTGRYEGIKGTITFAGRNYTPFKDETKGDALVEVIAKYQLPRKVSQR